MVKKNYFAILIAFMFLVSSFNIAFSAKADESITTLIHKQDIVVLNGVKYYPSYDLFKSLGVSTKQFQENGKKKFALTKNKETVILVLNERERIAYTSVGKFSYVVINQKYCFTENFYHTLFNVNKLTLLSGTDKVVIYRSTHSGHEVLKPNDELSVKLNKVAEKKNSNPVKTPQKTTKFYERGNATWYGDALHGNLTASGARFDMNALTAAHKTLPFGTVVKVTNLTNNKSVHVKITDRGPFAAGRIIDLSKEAARKIDMISSGVAEVRLDIIKKA